LQRTCEQAVKHVKKNTNSPPHFSQSTRSDTQLVKHSKPKHLSSVSGKKRSIIDKEDKGATQTMTKKIVHRSSILPESFHIVWAQKLSLLRAFKKETGHLNIESSLDSEKYPCLGYWTVLLRRAYRNLKIPHVHQAARREFIMLDEELLQLEALGYDLGDFVKKAWDSKFAMLKRFLSKYGHSNIRSKFDTVEFPKLGVWLQRQRKAFRNEMMRKKRSSAIFTDTY
jgi:hypothetical protein